MRFSLAKLFSFAICIYFNLLALQLREKYLVEYLRIDANICERRFEDLFIFLS